MPKTGIFEIWKRIALQAYEWKEFDSGSKDCFSRLKYSI